MSPDTGRARHAGQLIPATRAWKAAARLARALLLATALLLPAGVPLWAQAAPDPAVARADSLFAAGNTVAARAAYLEILDDDDSISRAWYQLARLAPRGSDEQVRLLRRYTQLEPGDAWGHLALGDALMRGRRPYSALQAYRSGLALEAADEDLLEGAARARTALRPAVEPIIAASRDSDGNRVLTGGAALLMTAPRDARLTLRVAQSQVSADEDATTTTLRAGYSPWLNERVRVTADAGVMRLNAAGEEGDTGGELLGVGSLLVRAIGTGVGGAEVRVTRTAPAATPQLVANRVTIDELRARATLPLFGPLGARGTARLARIGSAAEEPNRRVGFGAGLVAALSPLAELSVNAQRLGYQRPTDMGYFAPTRAEVAEFALYAERYPGDLVIAMDAGAGAQRVTRHEQEAGSWQPALRLWLSVATSAAAATQLSLELDAERSQLEAPAGATADWQYGSVRLSVRRRL